MQKKLQNSTCFSFFSESVKIFALRNHKQIILQTMKKIFITLAIITTCILSIDTNAQERPSTFDKLPAAAREFLNMHFKGLTIAFIVEDPKMTGMEYEVTYTDRTEVDFNASGEWSSIERKYSAVPASVIPKQISDFISNGNYSGQHIRKIEKERQSWEVELSNGLELKFDNQFNILGYDN